MKGLKFGVKKYVENMKLKEPARRTKFFGMPLPEEIF
jgi:hypothetical protein